jgi:Transglycosylase SLT domain
MRWWRQLTMIAPVAGLPFAAGLAIAGAPPPTSSGGAARIEGMVVAHSTNAETVRFAGNTGPPVTVVYGAGRAPGKPGTVEIIAFADSHVPPVRVVRGGGGLSAAALAKDRTLTRTATPRTTGEMVVAFADPRLPPVTVLRGTVLDLPDPGLFTPASGGALDRVAFAVDGAESSHGLDPRMWRPDPAGPQGPMQVSAAAAFDLGGGDRFDPSENRALGRAYLARLYRRYGNWPDAIAAYNWGLGNLDGWIADGRPADGLPIEVELYRDRVLHEIDMEHEVDMETVPAPLSSGRAK